jgi:hypothetical protein
MSSLPPIEPGRAPGVTVLREDGASAAMFAIRVLAVGVLAVGISLPAFAQTAPATKFTGFLCEIDLKPQANGGVDLTQFVTPAPEDGSVFTFNTQKNCSGSPSDRNIKVTCDQVLPGWAGGNMTINNPRCQVNGDACNFFGGPFLANGSQLIIKGNGAASLVCQYQLQ